MLVSADSSHAGPQGPWPHLHVLLGQDDGADIVRIHHAQDAATEDPRGRVRGSISSSSSAA